MIERPPIADYALPDADRDVKLPRRLNRIDTILTCIALTIAALFILGTLAVVFGASLMNWE